MVLADRGFTVQDAAGLNCAGLNCAEACILPFTRKSSSVKLRWAMHEGYHMFVFTLKG